MFSINNAAAFDNASDRYRSTTEYGHSYETAYCERCGAKIRVYDRNGEIYGRFALTYPDQHIVCENCMCGDDEPMWEEE